MAVGASGVSVDDILVDRVMLKRSIISCSFVVLIGAGGSTGTKALAGDEDASSGFILLLGFFGVEPPSPLCEDACDADG